MSQNPEFSLNSDTLGVVYKDTGVLEGYESAEAESVGESHAIVGAYYEPSGEYKGLYFVLPEGELKYFDIEAVKLGNQTNGAYITFEADNKFWIIRNLEETDGAWISKYKMELPVEVLKQLIVGRSKPALTRYLGVDIPDSIPEFESLTAYFSETSPSIFALNYMSSQGIYTRLDYEWERSEVSFDYYEDMAVAEIEASKASELLEKFDDADGIFPVKDVLKTYEVGGK